MIMRIESTLAKGYYDHYSTSSFQFQVQNRLLNRYQCSNRMPIKMISQFIKYTRVSFGISEMNAESINTSDVA